MERFIGGLLAGEDGRIRSGWKVLGFVIVQNLLAAGALMLHPHPGPDSPPWLPHEWFTGAVVLLASLACLRAEGRGLSSIGLRLDRRWARDAALGAFLGLTLMVATALAARSLGAFHWVRGEGTGILTLVSGLWAYTAVAFNEELLFRGYAFFRLREGPGAVTALAVTSVLFAAVHWRNPGMAGATRVWACVNIALAGILLGLAAWRTQSLALPIGLHLGWNWTQGSVLGFGVSGTEAKGLLAPVFGPGPAWISGGAFGLEASLPCAILCSAACVLLVVWPRRAAPPTDSGDLA
jgi:membrane protease YdiL (CAAX protease family)